MVPKYRSTSEPWNLDDLLVGPGCRFDHQEAAGRRSPPNPRLGVLETLNPGSSFPCAALAGLWAAAVTWLIPFRRLAEFRRCLPFTCASLPAVRPSGNKHANETIRAVQACGFSFLEIPNVESVARRENGEPPRVVAARSMCAR